MAPQPKHHFRILQNTMSISPAGRDHDKAVKEWTQAFHLFTEGFWQASGPMLAHSLVYLTLSIRGHALHDASTTKEQAGSSPLAVHNAQH